MHKTSVYDMTLTALGIALVFLATFLIKVPNGIQGYFNIGDGFLLLFAGFLHPFLAFLVGGLGSGLADIAGGYGIYFFFTLMIKGCEALVACLLIRKQEKLRYVAYVLGGCLMVIGYFFADALINESWLLSLTGIPANIIQALVGCVIATLAYPLLKRRLPS